MPLALPADDLFEAFFDLSLLGGILFAPVQNAAGEVTDLAYVRLNPVAQRLLALPEHPAESFLTRYPQALVTGVFAFYREAYESGEARRGEFNYQYDGLDNYFHLAARRVGEQLLVSFTDTSEQPRTAVEKARRESQTRGQQARADAETQRGELQRLFAQAPVAMALFRGPEYVIELANAPMAAIWGRTLAQVLGQPVFSALPYVRNQGFEALFADVLTQGTAYHLPEVAVALDREPTGQPTLGYFNLTYWPQRDGQGQPTGIITIAQEVTEQVLARRQVEQLNQELEARVQARTQQLEAAGAAIEHQLQAQARAHQRMEESAHLLRALVEGMPLPISLYEGPEFRIQLANQAILTSWGKGPSVIGQRFAEVLPELVSQGVIAQLQQVLATGQALHLRSQRLEVVMAGVPQTFYYTYSFTPLRDTNGRVYGILNTADNVTDQVLARQRLEASAAELQESEARFRTLADAAPNIVWDLNPDGSVRYVNAYCLRFLGITLAEFVASGWGPHLLPEDVGPTQQALAQAIGGRTLFSLEHRLRRHDGQYRWLLTQGGPSYYPNGELYGYVGSAIDITDLKQSNEQLRRTNVDLDNFIYTASHDLKAPISNIEGLLLALEHELPTAGRVGDVPVMLALMQGAVERFTRTIGHLTDISRLQKEHDQPREAVRLLAVIEDVQLDLAPLLHDTQARLRVDVPADLTLTFSTKNLRSVVYNLLSNALKYRHPDRVPEVRISCRPLDGYQVLEVQDNGLGLNLAQGEQQLFAMFQRLHTHVEGSGVGLYMVKRIVENAGGRIEVQSQLGHGSTFTVYVPQ